MCDLLRSLDARTTRALGMRDLLQLLDRYARTARALGMRDLLQSLETRELRERSGCAIGYNYWICANCTSARKVRSVEITRHARTARALGMHDLLQSLEMSELRQRSECAICCNHSRRANCESARNARSAATTRPVRSTKTTRVARADQTARDTSSVLLELSESREPNWERQGSHSIWAITHCTELCEIEIFDLREVRSQKDPCKDLHKIRDHHRAQRSGWDDQSV